MLNTRRTPKGNDSHRKMPVTDLASGRARKLARTFRGAVCCAILGSLGSCVVHETRPLPKINATQADHEIAQDELLDVGGHAFDPAIPPEFAKDEQALN